MVSSATLRDVAEMAGVSIGTASQALNKRPNVSADTRARVLEAAISLGYPIKDSAAAHNDHHLSVVGMLVMHDQGTEIAPNIFYSHVQSGVESECRKRGVSLMFSTIEVDQRKQPVEWPVMFRDQRIEGLLLIGTFLEDTVDQIQRQISVPIVLIDGYAPGLPFDSVLIDNHVGAVSAVDYLIQQGHEHIGLIGWRKNCHPSVQERKEGYLQSLASANIDHAYIEESPLACGAAVESFRRLKKRAPQISAIFACNDETAVGVLEAAREWGLRLPEDLSVIGFDNVDTARTTTPTLTTVHVHKAWMGMVGVRHLIDRAQNPDQPKITTRISTQLRIRESVCPLQNSLVSPVNAQDLDQ